MSLRVVMFQATPRARTVEALDAYAPGWELADVSADEGAYWRALSGLWDCGGYDLVTVEHDIDVHAQVVPQLEACPGDWCVFPYPAFPGALHEANLGCTRFSDRLRAAVPARAVLSAAALYWPDTAFCDSLTLRWDYIDGPVQKALGQAGYRVCLHWPPVTHRGLSWPTESLFGFHVLFSQDVI